MKTALVIGTRGSELACTQAGIVRSALLAIEPKMLIRITTITTHGDVNQRPVPLDTIGKGWFTKEIENALLSGAIDLAVHSLKDMAEDMPEGLHIGAYLPREDARDVLITKHGESLEELPQGAVIGTDSVRRQIQMRALRPDVNMQSLRGSVLTRLEKLEKEKVTIRNLNEPKGEFTAYSLASEKSRLEQETRNRDIQGSQDRLKTVFASSPNLVFVKYSFSQF